MIERMPLGCDYDTSGMIETLFSGKILNKSELRRILIQTEVVDMKYVDDIKNIVKNEESN
jgi:hypothetical protein